VKQRLTHDEGRELYLKYAKEFKPIHDYLMKIRDTREMTANASIILSALVYSMPVTPSEVCGMLDLMKAQIIKESFDKGEDQFAKKIMSKMFPSSDPNRKDPSIG